MCVHSSQPFVVAVYFLHLLFWQSRNLNKECFTDVMTSVHFKPPIRPTHQDSVVVQTSVENCGQDCVRVHHVQTYVATFPYRGCELDISWRISKGKMLTCAGWVGKPVQKLQISHIMFKYRLNNMNLPPISSAAELFDSDGPTVGVLSSSLSNHWG